VAARAPDEPPSALQLWPEEYLSGWDPAASRLFLPSLACEPLGSRVSLRITIRGTGIGATVAGPVVAVRRVPGATLTPGAYLSLRGRHAGAGRYLERVARGLPVEFNERDPRFAVAWSVTLAGEWGQYPATTENVSGEGCSLTWRGPALEVGRPVLVRRHSLFAPRLPARVCWSAVSGGVSSAGLKLEAGRGADRWRSALDREVRRGARMV
jgi:hypothetical protein